MPMSNNVYIERHDDGYVAIQNKHEITRGETQRQAVDNALLLRPDNRILVERVRHTTGSLDKWRRIL
jgi:hypothetical protein